MDDHFSNALLKALPQTEISPSLPFEITRHIILVSLPPVLRATYTERYDLLLNYSLVDSLWRGIAQEELVKHLNIRNKQPLGKLIKELERRTAAGSSPRVVSLRIDIGSRDSYFTIPEDVQQLFSKCKDAEEIRIEGSNAFGLLDILHSKGYTKLKALHLKTSHFISVEIPDPAFDLHFPALTHLTLSRVTDRGFDWLTSNLLKNSVLPSLNSFALFESWSTTFLSTTLPSSFVGQLKRLTLSHYSECLNRIDISRMNALEILVILNTFQLRSFTDIPSTLFSVRIHQAVTTATSYPGDLLELKEWINSVDTNYQLQEIYCPIPIPNPLLSKEYEDELKILQMVEGLNTNLLDFLAARGVGLKCVRRLSGHSKDESLGVLLNY